MSSVGCLSWRLTGAATAGASTPHGWARAMAAWSVNVHIMNKITLFPVTGQRGWGLVADIPRLALGGGRPGSGEVRFPFWGAQKLPIFVRKWLREMKAKKPWEKALLWNVDKDVHDRVFLIDKFYWNYEDKRKIVESFSDNNWFSSAT